MARDRGIGVLWGRGWEDAGAPAYWPWVQALRTLLRTETPEAIREYLGSGAADVAQILPELRTIVPDLPSRSPDSDAARFQLFDSTADLIRHAARERPILIVLDDLQAADTPSILLLQFLASQLSDMRLLIVGTYRDVELTPEHPLTPAIAEMAREPSVRVIALRGLEAEAVAQVIAAAAGTAPTGRVAAAVWRATNGNPLFVGEATRLLSAEGRLDDIGGADELRVAIPAGVHAVIARRIGYLGGPTIEALRLGSALGPEFSLDALARIGDVGEDRALDMIDEAIEAGLLLPVAGGRGRYRFSHDLVRETLYDELPPGRRVRLHRRIAGELEVMYGPAVAEHLAELAFHYVQATVRPDGTAVDDAPVGRKAIEYARRAGDQATAALAYEEAARLYRMALTVMALGGMADDDTQTRGAAGAGRRADEGRRSRLGSHQLPRGRGHRTSRWRWTSARPRRPRLRRAPPVGQTRQRHAAHPAPPGRPRAARRAGRDAARASAHAPRVRMAELARAPERQRHAQPAGDRHREAARRPGDARLHAHRTVLGDLVAGEPGGAGGRRPRGSGHRRAARRGRADRGCALHVVPPAERGGARFTRPVPS